MNRFFIVLILGIGLVSAYHSSNMIRIGTRRGLWMAKAEIEMNDLSSLISLAEGYKEEALETLQLASDSKSVETLRVMFLGKNGKITALMKEMRSLPKEDKPKLGEIVNKVKVAVELAVEVAKETLAGSELDTLIEKESLGSSIEVPGSPMFFTGNGRRHPLSQTMDLATRIFEEIGYEPVTGSSHSPQIENDFFNFEALGMPPNHPARDMQDTFYINTASNTNDTILLRTHTSAVQIREMEKRTPPFKIVCPGRVYRKDDIDATHYPCFHQVEILAIDEIGKLTVSHLLGTVKYFLQKMFGSDVDVKYRASYFPFTEPSMEVDVYFKGKWLEVLGCGMVDPVVLESVGLDPTKYGGFAAGFGVERFAMIMHGIQDIRLFYDNNNEFLCQFPSTELAIPGDDDEEIAADIPDKEFYEFDSKVPNVYKP
jgi:phenylalanyl-tRNA synthetase alpha chain